MKINLTFKKLVMVNIILILITLGLTFKIILQEKQYGCDKCIIKFVNYIGFGENKQKILIEEPIERLYQGYLNNECLVEWKKTEGYYSKRNLNVTYGG